MNARNAHDQSPTEAIELPIVEIEIDYREVTRGDTVMSMCDNK